MREQKVEQKRREREDPTESRLPKSKQEQIPPSIRLVNEVWYLTIIS